MDGCVQTNLGGVACCAICGVHVRLYRQRKNGKIRFGLGADYHADINIGLE